MFTIISTILPYLVASILTYYICPTSQQFLLIKSFSLLLLGMFLSALATLNFSLAFLIGLLSTPITFVPPLLPFNLNRHRHLSATTAAGLTIAASLALHLLSPSAVLYAFTCYNGSSVRDVLVKAAFGWDVWRMWTPVVVWCVWWPAWFMGQVLLASSFGVQEHVRK